MISLLLAAQLQLPVANQETFRHLLAGISALPKDDIASARVALWISVKGKVRECRVVAFVGKRENADLLCRKVVGARFNPARDQSGMPVPSVFTTVLGASVGSAGDPNSMTKWMSGALAPADFVINLSVLPPALKWDPRVPVTVMIDKEGRVAHCEADSGQISPEWVETACHEVKAGTFEPMTSEGQERVAYVRNIVVKFEASN